MSNTFIEVIFCNVAFISMEIIFCKYARTSTQVSPCVTLYAVGWTAYYC